MQRIIQRVCTTCKHSKTVKDFRRNNLGRLLITCLKCSAKKKHKYENTRGRRVAYSKLHKERVKRNTLAFNTRNPSYYVDRMKIKENRLRRNELAREFRRRHGMVNPFIRPVQ